MSVNFIVEDGSAKSDATSYISVADADQYFTDRDNQNWDLLSESEKQIALIKGSHFIDFYYKFPGTRQTRDQALNWPRDAAYDRDAYELVDVPAAVQHAAAEAAVRASDDDLLADEDRGGDISSLKIDVISIDYTDNAPAGTVYREIDKILFARGVATGKTGERPARIRLKKS